MLTKVEKINLTVSGFQAVEMQMLDCMNFVPFIAANKAVISPKFIPIILESCSLIDSTFKEATDSISKHPTLKDHSKALEPFLDLEEAITIALTSPLSFLNPFKGWTTKQPDWWHAYNQLKHDRLNNFPLATYETALQALAGLHQVIARSLEFLPVLVAAGWFNTDSGAFGELVAARIAGARDTAANVPAESRLFVSAACGRFVEMDDWRPRIDNECEFSSRVAGIVTAHEWL